MKIYFSIIAVLLLITTNCFSQTTFKKIASPNVKTPAVNVGSVKPTLIPKQSFDKRTSLVPMDTANAQMNTAMVDIAFNTPYRIFDVLGRYNLQIFLMNENNLVVAQWNFNRNKPNATQDASASNDGYFHVQLPMIIQNTKAASSFGSFKNGGSLKFSFDHSFGDIASGEADYFFINNISVTIIFKSPSLNTNMYTNNDQKYTASHKSSIAYFYCEGKGFDFK